MRYRLLAVLLASLLLAAAMPAWLAPRGAAPQVSPGATVSTGVAEAAGQRPEDLSLPLEPKSVRFAVIGDSGTGKIEQYQVAQEMERLRQRVGFDFVVMLGDNIYGGKDARSFARKFELPYKPLLDAGVKFYAALGNHDDPNEGLYAPFNMGGKRYYSFRKNNVAFFVLDSNYMDSTQLAWLEEQLRTSGSVWKICFFHHPLYSDARAHGADVDLRARLEPLLEKYGVNVVLAGHDHVYERLQPQGGIYYFVLGNSGQLRPHNLRHSPELAAGFDTDRDFMLVEITGDNFYFQTVSRTGQTVDAGVLQRQAKPAKASGAP